MRIRLMFICAVLGIPLVTAEGVDNPKVPGPAKNETPPKKAATSPRADDAPQVRVNFGYSDDSVHVHVVMTDPKMIKDLVEVPIAKAVVDPNPARYVVLGTMAIVTKDGTKYYSLFLPWGHFKHDNTYWIADFGDLQRKIVAELRFQMDAIRSQ